MRLVGLRCTLLMALVDAGVVMQQAHRNPRIPHHHGQLPSAAGHQRARVALLAQVAMLARPSPAKLGIGQPKRLRALATELQKIPRNADVATIDALLGDQQLKPQNLTTLLLALKRRQKWRASFLLAEWADTPGCPVTFSTGHYNLLIAACAKRAPNRALQMFTRMQARGIQPDVVTYNTAMTAAIALDKPRAALKLFEDMRWQAIAPTTISYNTAISACARCEDGELALSLFREMETNNIERTTVTYTGLIHACGEARQLDKAMALFTYMDVVGVERTLVTYSVAINACTRNGQWELGLQVQNILQYLLAAALQ